MKWASSKATVILVSNSHFVLPSSCCSSAEKFYPQKYKEATPKKTHFGRLTLDLGNSCYFEKNIKYILSPITSNGSTLGRIFYWPIWTRGLSKSSKKLHCSYRHLIFVSLRNKNFILLVLPKIFSQYFKCRLYVCTQNLLCSRQSPCCLALVSAKHNVMSPPIVACHIQNCRTTSHTHTHKHTDTAPSSQSYGTSCPQSQHSTGCQAPQMLYYRSAVVSHVANLPICEMWRNP